MPCTEIVLNAIDVGKCRPVRKAARREFPIGPLLAATGLTRTGLRRQVHASGHDVAVAATEGLTSAQADIWAVRSGFHPADVWPHLWWKVAE